MIKKTITPIIANTLVKIFNLNKVRIKAGILIPGYEVTLVQKGFAYSLSGKETDIQELLKRYDSN